MRFLGGAALAAGLLTLSSVVASADAPDPAPAPSPAPVAASTPDPAAAPAPAPAAGGNMTTVYLVLLRKGPAWTPEETPATRAIQESHMANIRRMWQDHKLIIAGPTDDPADLRGVFVFKAASVEEARALAATDPAVKAGRLAATVYPWWVDRRALPEAGSYCTTETAK
jgi:uncharacterized protein YciI